MIASPAVAWQCPPKTVLVAVDFGEASARALALGGVMALAFGARLRALHAERFEPPPYFTIEQIARLEAERRASQAAAAAHLARFAAQASTYRVEPMIVDEPPVEAVLDGSAGADLIVVGTHGRRGPGRWWLGSVAERIVRGATIPVLVTRAAATAPGDVFERLVLVHDGTEADPNTRACVARLATVGGGSVIDAGSVTQCDAGVMKGASLVVVATSKPRHSGGITDSIAKVLGACERPVLFIPVR